MIKINKQKYQFYVPDNKKCTTRDPHYKLLKKWYYYYHIILETNYFTEDELEFLNQLKKDLIKEIEETDIKIKRLELNSKGDDK